MYLWYAYKLHTQVRHSLYLVWLQTILNTFVLESSYVGQKWKVLINSPYIMLFIILPYSNTSFVTSNFCKIIGAALNTSEHLFPEYGFENLEDLGIS